MRGLQRPADDFAELGAERLELDLPSQAGAECLERAGGVDLRAVEAAVDERLDPPPGGAEKGGDGEGRSGDGELVPLCEGAERGLEPDDDAEVEARERCGQEAVDERAVDDPVDLVQAVAEDRDPGSDRDRREREADQRVTDLLPT